MERVQDRFRGALLGTLLGDAVGAPWEGTDAGYIAALCDAYPGLPPAEQEMNRAIFGLLLGDAVPSPAHYTDDTQMTLALAETLTECGAALRGGHEVPFEARLAARFADAFDPARGYGPGAQSVLLALRRGAPWDEPARRLFGGSGSFGNGAAMRVAPVGFLFHDAAANLLRQVARRSALPTHTHPLGIGGALMQAAAVAVACRLEPSSAFDTSRFLADVVVTLGEGNDTATYRDACHNCERLLALRPSADAVGGILGCDVSAPGSVPAALYSFLAHPNNFTDAVTFAINMGGDTDTIGAMCGAISGAYLGASALPTGWLAAVENGWQGRDYTINLADRLFACWAN